MSIKSIQEEIVEEFSILDEWMDKYKYLIDLGDESPPFDEVFKKEEFLIKGCQSKVWLHTEFLNGKIIFTADSNVSITKGIAALLVRVLSGHSPDEILQTELTFINEIGLKEHLSPTRSNGLVSMLKQMRYYALAYKTKQSN